MLPPLPQNPDVIRGETRICVEFVQKEPHPLRHDDHPLEMSRDYHIAIRRSSVVCLVQMDISIEKAKQEKLFYFVVTGVIFRPSDGRCLILQRSKKEIAHPGLWGVIGGKLEWDDLRKNPMTRQNFDIPNWEGLAEKLLFREAKEESGLTVVDPRYLESVVFIRPDKVPVVCVKFAVKYKRGKVKIAPEFDDYAWVNPREVKKYQTIEGIDREVAKTMQIYSKRGE